MFTHKVKDKLVQRKLLYEILYNSYDVKHVSVSPDKELVERYYGYQEVTRRMSAYCS